MRLPAPTTEMSRHLLRGNFLQISMTGHTLSGEETRVIVAGKGTSTGIEDDNTDWNEEKLIGDYDVAIFDLHDLEQRSHEFVHPFFKMERAVEFPSSDIIRNHLEAGNDIVVRLPTKQRVESQSPENVPQKYDLLRWLPFKISLADESGEKLVAPEDQRWEWEQFFTGSENKSMKPINGWDNAIEEIRTVPGEKSDYPNPISDEEAANPKSLADSISPAIGNQREINKFPILYDNIERLVAARVSLKFYDDYLLEKMVEEAGMEPLPAEGNVFLLPPASNLTHTEFVERILWAEYGIVKKQEFPQWLDDYPLPGENRLKERLDELMNSLEELEENVEMAQAIRDQLLFGQHEDLEKTVRAVFERLGFEVDGEVSGGRDGAIHAENRVYILEVTGQVGGVKESKIDRLERHMKDARDDYDKDLVGLLVYNHRRERPPGERELNPQNFKDDLIEKNQKLLTTIELHHLLDSHLEGELSSSEIEQIIENSNPIISVNDHSDSEESSAEEILEIVKRAKERFKF